MFYHEAGDIVYIKNSRFRDTNTIDPKSSRRPFIFLCDYEFHHDTGYLLKLSTSEGKGDSKNYYKIVPNRFNKLKRISYIDLRYVYDVNLRNGKVRGYIDSQTLKKIINKLEAAQKVNVDSVYMEYLEIVES